MAAASPAPDSEILPLVEFVQTFELPQPAMVARGKYAGRRVQVYKGDVLLLRSHLPNSLTLSFRDADGRKRAVSVDPSTCQVKFLVLPARKRSSGVENVERVEYPTICDLVQDCPTYFEATANFDEPYLPACSVRNGDVFRFMRVWRDPRDGVAGVECLDRRGNPVRLAGRCRGNFVPLQDESAYTLRELVLQARVARRLRLAPVNVQLQINTAELRSSGKLDALVSQLESIRARTASMDEAEAEVNSMCSIPELPLTFKGVINLHKPQNDLIVSPWKELDIRWKIPLSVDLFLRRYSPDEYEQPVEQAIPTQNISKFIESHESSLPALATLMSYPDMHQDLVPHLKNISDIIVHRAHRIPRLLVKSESSSDYFLISGQTNIRLCDTPRCFTSVVDLLTCPVGTQIRVLESIAADFPEPVVLKKGNMLRITQNEVTVKKMRSSTVSECRMLKCELLGDNGLFKKIKLPLDFELNMMQILTPETMKIYTINDLLHGHAAFPHQSVELMEDYSDRDLPLPPRVEIVDVIPDKVIIVSPLSFSGDQFGISPLVQQCLEIPERHKNVLLSFGRALNFPQTYFVMPKETSNINIRCERLTRQEAEYLRSLKSDLVEYEDVDLDGGRQSDCHGAKGSDSCKATDDVTCPKTRIGRSQSTGAINKKNQTLEKSRNAGKRISHFFGQAFGRKNIEEQTRGMASIDDLSGRPRPPSTNEYQAAWMDAPLPPKSNPPSRPAPQPVAPPRRHRRQRHRAEGHGRDEQRLSNNSIDDYTDEDPYEDVMPTALAPVQPPDPPIRTEASLGPEPATSLPQTNPKQANGLDKKGRFSGRFRRKKNPSTESSSVSQEEEEEQKSPTLADSSQESREKGRLSDFKDAVKKRFSRH